MEEAESLNLLSGVEEAEPLNLLPALFLRFIWDSNNDTMPDIPASFAICSAVCLSLHARRRFSVRVKLRVVN